MRISEHQRNGRRRGTALTVAAAAAAAAAVAMTASPLQQVYQRSTLSCARRVSTVSERITAHSADSDWI